jgi:dihydrodipicolinate synthase/N-acetylneuraminate lyase
MHARSGIRAFRQVNDKVAEIQIMAYNNLGSFRFNMDKEFWDRLMTLDRIKAVKESNGDATHRTTVISHISKKMVQVRTLREIPGMNIPSNSIF